MSDFDFNDENEWLKNWRINQEGIASNEGRCSNFQSLGDRKYSDSEDDREYGLFNYYVCGNSSSGCHGLTDSEWRKIWDNCKNHPDTNNYDKCFNSVINSDVTSGRSFKAGCDNDLFSASSGGWNGGSSSPEVEGPCASGRCGPAMCGGTCFSDESCLDWWHKGNDGTMNFAPYKSSPAYPTTLEGTKIDTLNDDGDFSTSRGDPKNCPEDLQNSRSFICAGDGNSEDQHPGCGSGKEIDGLEDGIRFCSRDSDNYEHLNLMECCLNDKGDPKNMIHRECPVNYCRSSISQNDIIDSPTVCEEGDGDDLLCYEMTQECNDLFETQCTAELFSDSTGTKIEEQTNCRKWAKIQPAKFQRFAENICSIRKRLSLSEDEDVTSVLQTSDSKRTIVKRLFNSDLCRDYLLDNSNIDSKRVLKEICAAGVEMKSETEWEVTEFGRSMSGLCDCHYPDEYYQWYKTFNEELSEDEKRAAAGKVRPECFHMGCARSGNYSTVGNTECPDVQLCIQTINDYSTVVAGSRFGDVQRQPASRQSCNFNIINPDGGPTMLPDTGDPIGTIPTSDDSGGTLTGSSGGQYGSGDGYSSGQGDYQTDSYSSSNYREEEGTSSTGDDNTMTILIIVGIIMFCCMGIMMMAMGGGGGGGRGYGPPPPRMYPYY